MTSEYLLVMNTSDSIGHTAEKLVPSLEREFSDQILAVGWYDVTQDERTGVVYESDGLGDKSENAEDVLESALFESISHDLQERIHGESLRSTVHIYESIVDVNLPVSEYKGLVIATHPGATGVIGEVIQFVQNKTGVDVGISK